MPRRCFPTKNHTPPMQPPEMNANWRRKTALGAVLGLITAYTIIYGTKVVVNGEIGVTEKASGPLPAAVAAQVPHAVHIEGRIPTHQRLLPNGKLEFDYRDIALSGVSLGHGLFLSAGHGIVTPEHPSSPDAIQCAKIAISGIYESRPYIVQTAGNVAQNSTMAGDLAMYKITKGNEHSATRKPGVGLPTGPKISDQPLEEGEVVYFVNWQPTHDGKQRQPDAPAGFNTPAIFPGVVTEEGATPRVVTDIQSLGSGVPDQVNRLGSSGGGVFRPNGELVGLSNGIENTNWTHEVFNLHIGPFGLPGNGRHIAVITPVTAEQVVGLAKEAQFALPC